jgi:hypothetical protein
MIIKEIHIENFRAMHNQSFRAGKRLTAIAGRNGTMKSTLLGMLGQPFSISNKNKMHGSKTIEGYNYKSQFQEKFCLSKEFDTIGTHIWTLRLCNTSFYNNTSEYTVKSVSRSQSGHQESIRFVNAKGKNKGMGYIQLPVIYLSLSRLFPIGESGKTKSLPSAFTKDEKDLYIQWYKEILSIQAINSPTVELEKKDLKRVFTGVGDKTHDVTTCSAGEGNVGRVITSILSFKRLKDKFEKEYKGGILLIDELDATLYGYSQKKFIHFLNEKSKEYKIQIFFTTHSPIILKEVSNLQRNELRKNKIQLDNINTYCFENEIIYLSPQYNDNSVRCIEGENIHTAVKLKTSLNDINLSATKISQNINLYLEDQIATNFLKSIFDSKKIQIKNYINFIDVNLGWTNYLSLHQKKIPEFCNSLIVFDNDVKDLLTLEQEDYINKNACNIVFMPEDVEKGLFAFLKNHCIYNEFEKEIKQSGLNLSYDVCFRDWPENEYETKEYKAWFSYISKELDISDVLYVFWIKKNKSKVNDFINKFITAYNSLAERLELDYLIPEFDS